MSISLTPNAYIYSNAITPISQFPFSFSVWIKPAAIARGWAICYGDTDGSTLDGILLYDDATVRGLSVHTIPQASIYSSYTTGSWVHAAYVLSAKSGSPSVSDNRTVYYNGNAGTPNANELNFIGGYNGLALGVEYDSGMRYYFNGEIAEAGVWDSELSVDDIAALSKGIKPIYIQPKNLVFYLPLIRSYKELINGITFLDSGTVTVSTHSPTVNKVLTISPPSQAAISVSVQYARPSSDVSSGSWINELGGSDLFSSIDEATASDTDYITADLVVTPGNTCEVALSAIDDPGVSGSHIVRYRYQLSGAGSGSLIVYLMDGASITGSWINFVEDQTWHDAEQTLTDAEADSISNYGNLRLRFTAITE